VVQFGWRIRRVHIAEFFNRVCRFFCLLVFRFLFCSIPFSCTFCIFFCDCRIMVYKKCNLCNKRLENGKSKHCLSSLYYIPKIDDFRRKYGRQIPSDGIMCASCHLIMVMCAKVCLCYFIINLIIVIMLFSNMKIIIIAIIIFFQHFPAKC